jgi:hypothetical protein
MDQFDIGRLFVSSVNKTVQVGGVLLESGASGRKPSRPQIDSIVGA